MLKYIQYKDKSLCCGCRACEQVCSRRAITMQIDEEGFYYPELNFSQCNSCGLCEKVCPISNSFSVLHQESKVYAVQNLDKETLKKSSSGAVFSVIAQKVLQADGVVYGAAFDEEMILSHIRISDVNDLSKLRGSKYLQSNTGNTFEQTKQDLKQGKQVYYTGTPCQIAGLRLFLRKDYDNLITSDLICHGTPSQKIFSTVLSQIEKEKQAKIVQYSFRDKAINGWSCSSSSSSIKKEEKTKYLPYNLNMQAYFNAFTAGHLFQRVCYECPFSKAERVGDITLADYWGIRLYHPEFPNINEGVSLVLLNNEKAISFWNTCTDNVFQIESDIKKAQERNTNLREASPYSQEREIAYELAFNQYEIFRTKYLPPKALRHKLRFYIKFFLKTQMPFVFNILRKIKK